MSVAVRVITKGEGHGLVVDEAVAAGLRILVFEGDEHAQPTRHSVQVDANVHMHPSDQHEWRFLNHACEPNARIRGRDLIASQDLAPGDEITFDYNTTEYEMATPFPCSCGAAACRGTIRGATHLSEAEQRSLAPRMNEHLRRTLDLPMVLHEIFARTARDHPEQIALEIPPSASRPERVQWTYVQFYERAKQLAARMASVQRGDFVALLLPRDHPDLYAGELAAMMACGAYVAMDPKLPDVRLRYMLDDSQAEIVVASSREQERLLKRVRATEEEILFVDAESTEDIAEPEIGEACDLAYMIYTSGTTGEPKGVLIEHQSIVNLVQSDVRLFDLGPGDRVAQGSSHAYDSSVEEMWLAWGVGATVVVLDDETVRMGPDLAGWLRDERITVFCPPPTLLRAMDVDDPAKELPDVRLVYVGGEPLPQQVADAWAPGRALVNGYGPTECAVTTIRSRVRAGEPVVIGSPVEGNEAFVVDGTLDVVPDGNEGELILRGVALARGYLNRPELTAAAFPTHPTLGRVYRTGDLARKEPNGDFVHLGRIDAQVKVRGHRIELGAVETHLATLPGIRAAGCTTHVAPGGNVLVAFLVPSNTDVRPSLEVLTTQMRERVPDAMVPSRFEWIDALPTTVGGKLDRKALPAAVAVTPEAVVGVMRSADEDKVAKAFAFGLPGMAIERDLDFFVALGGDSIAAARTISHLRKHEGIDSLTVRDLYEARTVAAMAARIVTPSSEPQEPARLGPQPGARPLWATAIQTLWLLIGVWFGAGLLYVGLYLLLPFLLRHLGLTATVLGLPLLGFVGFAVFTPLSVFALALCKRVLIGRYEPCREPVWSGYYVRHWMLTTMAGLVPWRALQGTVFLNAALRVLGARVGKRVHIHGGVDFTRGGWDLLDIGDDASIGRDASLRLVDLVDGEVVVGPVAVGPSSVVETRAGMDAHTTLGTGAHLTSLSWLPSDRGVPDGERWSGVPAKRVAPAAPLPDPSDASMSPGWHGVLSILMRFALGLDLYLIAVALPVFLMPGWDTDTVLTGLFAGPSNAAFFGTVIALIVGARLLGTVLSAVMVRALGRVEAGTISRWGWRWIRVSLKMNAVAAAGRTLSGTLFWPVWLRGAGMQIGRGSEVSTIDDVVPELVSIGETSFLADGIYLGSPDVRDGRVRLGRTSLGDETFVGNHVVVPSGQQLPSDLLIGVCTVADDERMQPASSWFGHPAFELPRRAPEGVDRSLTHEPGARRYLTRLFFESLRFVLPVPPWAVLLVMLGVLESVRGGMSTGAFVLGALPMALLASGATLCLLVLATKWLLLGRVRPASHGLWSFWCCRWDFFYVAWGAWARAVLVPFEGTLWLAWYLRAMGMRVGKRAILGGGFAQVVDPDMITIEDDATVNALFQAHTFEDRLLKIDRVDIEPGATVGAGAVLFYGARVGAGTHVMPQGVVMKHEHLTAGRIYEGCPTAVR